MQLYLPPNGPDSVPDPARLVHTGTVAQDAASGLTFGPSTLLLYLLSQMLTGRQTCTTYSKRVHLFNLKDRILNIDSQHSILKNEFMHIVGIALS